MELKIGSNLGSVELVKKLNKFSNYLPIYSSGPSNTENSESQKWLYIRQLHFKIAQLYFVENHGRLYSEHYPKHRHQHQLWKQPKYWKAIFRPIWVQKRFFIGREGEEFSSDERVSDFLKCDGYICKGEVYISPWCVIEWHVRMGKC